MTVVMTVGELLAAFRPVAEQMLLKIADDLQDFIAESAFAWGELRPIPPLGQEQ
ncbi:hypothetical protein [Curtobacterium sp. C2H10]|uniref:hypothetical protein n=1 Tax=Curtobacterium sp. C2H10 TaxID=2736664 RepID=UPI0021C0B48D|nr:hypothetical protein [Curtobacterium sp. C2H10]MCT9622200.1 hypothetical protein [Curtobacterium sp. C2H10]